MHRLAHVLVLSAKDAEALRRLAGCYARVPEATALDQPRRNRARGQRRSRSFPASGGDRRKPCGNGAKRLGRLCRRSTGAGSDSRRSLARCRGSPSCSPRQGRQYPDMARSLYSRIRASRECSTNAMPYRGRTCAGRCSMSYSRFIEDDADLINETEFTQPAPVRDRLRTGRPVAVVGRRSGRPVSGTAWGNLSPPARREASTSRTVSAFVARRAQLMQALPKTGAMAAVFTDERRVEASLAGSEDEVSIAAVNAPFNTVISGDRQALEAVVENFATKEWRRSRSRCPTPSIRRPWTPCWTRSKSAAAA